MSWHRLRVACCYCLFIIWFQDITAKKLMSPGKSCGWLWSMSGREPFAWHISPCTTSRCVKVCLLECERKCFSVSRSGDWRVGGLARIMRRMWKRSCGQRQWAWREEGLGGLNLIQTDGIFVVESYHWLCEIPCESLSPRWNRKSTCLCWNVFLAVLCTKQMFCTMRVWVITVPLLPMPN